MRALVLEFEGARVHTSGIEKVEAVMAKTDASATYRSMFQKTFVGKEGALIDFRDVL